MSSFFTRIWKESAQVTAQPTHLTTRGRSNMLVDKNLEITEIVLKMDVRFPCWLNVIQDAV